MCKLLIAGHCFIIKTTNAEATDALLPTFRPFRLKTKRGQKCFVLFFRGRGYFSSER